MYQLMPQDVGQNIAYAVRAECDDDYALAYAFYKQAIDGVDAIPAEESNPRIAPSRWHLVDAAAMALARIVDDPTKPPVQQLDAGRLEEAGTQLDKARVGLTKVLSGPRGLGPLALGHSQLRAIHTFRGEATHHRALTMMMRMALTGTINLREERIRVEDLIDTAVHDLREGDSAIALARAVAEQRRIRRMLGKAALSDKELSDQNKGVMSWAWWHDHARAHRRQAAAILNASTYETQSPQVAFSTMLAELVPGRQAQSTHR